MCFSGGTFWSEAIHFCGLLGLLESSAAVSTFPLEIPKRSFRSKTVSQLLGSFCQCWHHNKSKTACFFFSTSAFIKSAFLFKHPGQFMIAVCILMLRLSFRTFCICIWLQLFFFLFYQLLSSVHFRISYRSLLNVRLRCAGPWLHRWVHPKWFAHYLLAACSISSPVSSST